MRISFEDLLDASRTKEFPDKTAVKFTDKSHFNHFNISQLNTFYSHVINIKQDGQQIKMTSNRQRFFDARWLRPIEIFHEKKKTYVVET